MKKSGQEKSGKGGPAFGSGDFAISPSIKDALWKDMLQHEKNLGVLWHWKWDSLLQPAYWPPWKRDLIKKRSKGMELCADDFHHKENRYSIKSAPLLPSFPKKSSGTIGWISADKDNSFDMFMTKPTRPKKIRFKDEQYGYYRVKRYLSGVNEEIPEHSVPTSRIIHRINPLLC